VEPYCYNAEVKRVVDGDTVILNIDLGFDVVLSNQKVRLYGIDTPECRTRDLEEKEAGLLAKDKVKFFLKKGDRVTIKTRLDKGKFGRILGVIDSNGINVNDFLIENHYAVVYKGQSKEEVQEAHKQNYEILRNNGELKNGTPES
jgi:endonuclease YncB( thermonuclease family)